MLEATKNELVQIIQKFFNENQENRINSWLTQIFIANINQILQNDEKREKEIEAKKVKENDENRKNKSS